MGITDLIRFFHLLSYLVITGQLLYYVFVMATALQQVSISNFIEQRKIVDPLVRQRHIPVYYVCLLLSILVVVQSIPVWDSLLFISVVIAFLCLVLDILLAKKENEPINSFINKHDMDDPGIDWEELRTKWLRFIRIRGAISLGGFVSVLAGIFWR